MNDNHELDPVDDFLEREMKLEIELKILHILGIYPIISPTMLQAGLGPSMKPALWRPVLLSLIANGKVIEDHESLLTPTERSNTYTKLSLPIQVQL